MENGFWIARDKNGELHLYYDEREPERTEEGEFWRGNVLFRKKYIKLNKWLFPEITWENSPQFVELKLKENGTLDSEG